MKDFTKVSDKRRLNSTAMFCYTITTVILAVSYLVEVLKKSRTVQYFIVFMILLMIPMVACRVLLAKDKDSDKVKYAIAGGFFILNCFVIFTTVSPIAYVYAIMIAAINHFTKGKGVKGSFDCRGCAMASICQQEKCIEALEAEIKKGAEA